MIVQESAGVAAKATYPDYKGGFSLNLGGGERDRLKGTFAWNGVEWAAQRVVRRIAWFAPIVQTPPTLSTICAAAGTVVPSGEVVVPPG